MHPITRQIYNLAIINFFLASLESCYNIKILLSLTISPLRATLIFKDSKVYNKLFITFL